MYLKITDNNFELQYVGLEVEKIRYQATSNQEHSKSTNKFN